MTSTYLGDLCNEVTTIKERVNLYGIALTGIVLNVGWNETEVE